MNTLAPPPEKLDNSNFEEIRSTPVPSAREINISFFSHRHRRSTQLVGNQFENNFIKARREWMDFDFTEIIYITSITVYAEGYEEYHELELSYKDLLSGTTKIVVSRYDGNAFNFKPDCFIGGFGLRPNERWFKDSKLTRIELEGVEQRSFSDVIAVMSNLNSEISRIESGLSAYLEQAKVADRKRVETDQRRIEVELEVEESSKKLEELNEEIYVEKENLDTLKKEIGINEAVRRRRTTFEPKPKWSC